MPKKYLIDDLWHHYCHLIKMPEERMPPIQRSEMKKAFYAGCGELLLLLRDEVSGLKQDQALKTFENLMDQVSEFFAMEIKKQEN